MGNDDKLGLFCQIPQISGKPFYIPVVQCCVDFVQHTERCGTNLQNSKVQSDRHEGLFAAGEQSDSLQLLSGRLHPNFDAAGQRLLRVFQHQLTLTTTEHLFKGLTEVGVDLLEFFHEDLCHLSGNILDDTFQIPLGGQHIIPLLGQVAVTLIDTGKFLNST